MDAPPPRTLELTLVHQGNPFIGLFAPFVPRFVVIIRGSTARLDLALPEERRAECRFGAAGASVDEATTWRDVPLASLEALIAELEPLCFRAVDVDGVVDTGDYSQTLTLTGLLDDNPFGLRVSQMQSGIRGADAPAFAALLRRILAIGGLSLDDPRWSGIDRVRDQRSR